MRSDAAAAVAVPAAAVAALGLRSGGYFPASWGWAAAGLALVAAAALGLRRRWPVGRAGIALLAAVAAVVAWAACSLAWTLSTPRTLAEVELGFVYVAATAAFLAVATPSAALLVGSLVGTEIVCLDGLVRYAFQHGIDRFEGALLFRPVGYANGLGAMAAIGLVLAVGLSATLAPRWAGVGAAAPPAAALAATQSRGAVIALVCALAVGIVFVRGRQGIAARAVPALGTAVAAGVLGAVVDPGDVWLLPALAGICLAGGIAAARLPSVSGRAVLGLVVAALAAAVVLGVRTGVGLGDRPAFWRAALASSADAPVGGTGAGTFELDWLLHRRSATATRDAHSLELETLAELGPVGLIAVLVLLAVPFYGAWRRRGDAIATVALAAYAVLVVHSALDWDWEQPAVWLAGLAPAVALVTEPAPRAVARALRVACVTALGVLAVVAAAGWRGNQLLQNARVALAQGRIEDARALALRAADWQPWASAPLLTQARADVLLARSDLARDAARKALNADPNDPEVLRAFAALNTGPVADAANALAAKRDPLGPLDGR